MIVGTCRKCQTLIYGGVTPGVWVDKTAKGSVVDSIFCKDEEGKPTEESHEPHMFYTRGDGVVVYDNRYHRYIFVESPRGYSQLGKGMFMPEDWELM